MSSALRPLTLIPAPPLKIARALITMTHQKQHYILPLNILLAVSLLTALFTFSLTLTLPPPLPNSTCTSPSPQVELTLPPSTNPAIAHLLTTTTILLFSSTFDILLLHLLLIPLSTNDLIHGLRGKVLKFGFWFLGLTLAASFLLLTSILGIHVTSSAPSAGNKAVAAIAATIVTVSVLGLAGTGLGTRGVKSAKERRGSVDSDNAGEGVGHVPPTPGTREERVLRERREGGKVGDLGWKSLWGLGVGWFVKGLALVGLLGVGVSEVVRVGNTTCERRIEIPREVKLMGCVDICARTSGTTGLQVIWSTTTSSLTEKETSTQSVVVTTTPSLASSQVSLSRPPLVIVSETVSTTTTVFVGSL